MGERISLRNESGNIYTPPPDATPLVAKTSNRKPHDCVNYHHQLNGVEVRLSFFLVSILIPYFEQTDSQQAVEVLDTKHICRQLQYGVLRVCT